MSDDTNETTQTLLLDLPVAPTVLIVDDDPLVLARLREIVAGEGYVVHTAAGGMEALNSIEKLSPSIVVSDLNMPEVNGLDLCRRIRERASHRYIYIVLLTVRADESDILAGLDAGADDYLSKRSSAALFKARLRTAKRVLALEHSLKDALARKRVLAMSDSLTGVFNRRYFMRHMSRELKRAQRFGGDVSLLLLDIDHFKDINDTYGHATGDLVLKRITKQLGRCLQRETDWCARLGGDEFVVVLEGTKIAQANICAETVRKAIVSEAIDTPLGTAHFTVSIGVGGLEELQDRGSATVQSLLERADSHLYISKAQGRNRITSSNITSSKEIDSALSAQPWTPPLRSCYVKPRSALRSVR
jgi:two-component system cell cycle response regulator